MSSCILIQNYTYSFIRKVLSNTVAEVIEYDGDPETQETAQFCRVFNKSFDCLNVHSLDEFVFSSKNQT